MCRIADVDLFACEANYHKSCYRDYLRNQDVGRSKNENAMKEQKELEEVHALAFSKIREIIDQEVILAKNVFKLPELREKYVEYLSKTRFPNPAYRAEKLKSKLEKFEAHKESISFTQLENKGKFESCLMYNKIIKLDSAILHVYQSGQSEIIKEAGMFLRQSILNAFLILRKSFRGHLYHQIFKTMTVLSLKI